MKPSLILSILAVGIFFGLQFTAFVFRNYDNGTPSNILFYATIPWALITLRITKALIKKEKSE